MKRSKKNNSSQISLSFGPIPIRRSKVSPAQNKLDFLPEGDWILLVLALTLSIGGLIMVYNTSSLIGERSYHDSFYFIKKQLQWFLIGMAAFFITSRLNADRLRDWIMPMAALVFVLLISVLIFGTEINGARRWLKVGALSFQPSEIAKLFTIIYLGHYIAKKGEKLKKFLEGAAPPLILIGLLSTVILLEPDFGTAVVILSITLLLLFIGGVPPLQLLLIVSTAVPVFVYWIISSPYRLKRISAFLNPWEAEYAGGFQIIQSQVALGSGGLTGTGLAEGKQVLFFLPEPHTDFIFSVIGESFGLLGTTLVVVLFAGILWRGARTTLQVTAPYQRIIAIGMTLLITLPAILNMGVVTGLLPTKGLALPFVSYGGSSLLMNSIALGFLYNVSRGVNQSSRQVKR